MQSMILKSTCSSSICRLSTREKSRMSLMMLRRISPLFLMMLRCCFCSSETFSWRRISVKPMMPLRGVRISWLIVARKRDLASFALMADWEAFSRSASICLRSVMSRMIS